MSNVSEQQLAQTPQFQAPAGDPKATAKAAKAYAKAMRPWYKKKRFLVPIGLVAVIGLSQAAGGETAPTVADVPAASAEAKDAPQSKDDAGAPEAEAEPEKVEPVESVSQENARESADDYLSMTAFSRSGLIEQLEFEGYSTKDATYGVDSLKADWNEQAAKSAEAYLEMTAFSRSGLIEQLTFEGYTPAQAEYGVSKTGL